MENLKLLIELGVHGTPVTMSSLINTVFTKEENRIKVYNNFENRKPKYRYSEKFGLINNVKSICLDVYKDGKLLYSIAVVDSNNIYESHVVDLDDNVMIIYIKNCDKNYYEFINTKYVIEGKYENYKVLNWEEGHKVTVKKRISRFIDRLMWR